MKLNLGLQIEGSATAADWVKQSRLREKEISIQEAKKQAELLLKRQDEEDEELLALSKIKQAYSAADLKGLKIMHDFKDFEAGQDVILTLADSSIVATGEVRNTQLFLTIDHPICASR